jgi:hypothetical protein
VLKAKAKRADKAPLGAVLTSLRSLGVPKRSFCRRFSIVSLVSVRYNCAMTETKNIRQDWLSIPRRREEERLDPHVYKRGVNGLTVEEATRRAFPRVMDILARSGEEYSEFERQLVRQTVRACLISQVSRANLYRIAGILVADRRDEGAHMDTSLALAYVAALREAFITELSVGERVRTPLGVGEVRYVSGDGSNVAIRLDNDYEVWLPAERVSRPGAPLRRAS